MWKQIGGVAAIILSIVMLVISIVCFILVLTYRQPLIDLAGKLLGQADTALNIAVESTDTAVLLTGEAQALLDETQSTLNEAVDEVGARKDELVRDAQTVFDQRFGVQLSTALATIRAVTDSMRAARELALSISRIPGVNLRLPGSAVADDLAVRTQEIETTAQEVGDRIERVTAVPGEAMDATNAGLTELSQKIGDVEAALANVNEEVIITQQTVRALQEDYVRTINLTVTILCLILAWTIISQVIVMRWAWKLTRQAEAA